MLNIRMTSILVTVLSLLLLMTGASSQAFNTFKAYDKSDNPPDQYSRPLRKKVKHAVGEYLTDQQQMMMAKRNGPDEPQDMWGPAFSGKATYNKLKSSVGKSATGSSSSTNTKVSGNLRGTKANGISTD